ncbi:MAG TPA: hypothetical protein VFU21_23030 [Kofleriaceae bacterium]|nr:hypothetical protein [Kofleriaceae bacterium]
MQTSATEETGGRLSRARRRLQELARAGWQSGPRRAAVGAAVAIWIATTVWFFGGHGAQGRTAQLTADAWYYHAYLPSLFMDGDLDFADEYRVTGNWYRFGKTDTGRMANVFGVGPAVFEAPVFLAAHAVVRGDGFAAGEVEPVLYLSLLFSLAALVPVGILLRRRLGARYGAVAVPVLLAAAGPVVYYAIRQPGYAHPAATFWVALLVERWDASHVGGARSLRTWLGLGALLGAAALARPQCALWGILLAEACADDLRHIRRGPDWRRALVRQLAPRWLAAGVAALVVFAPQLVAWQSVYGEWVTTPQGPGFMWWSHPAVSETLFSSRNGLFPWAPLYALAAIGLVVAAVRAPRLGIALSAGVLLQAWVNGAVWDWWAGGSFGGRRYDSTFVAFAIGLGALLVWPETGRQVWLRRAALAAGYALAALLAAGNLVFAGTQSSSTVRIQGGQAASKILEKEIGGPLGAVTGAASALANLPARLLFAWRHGTASSAYDKLVGVHQLGELYPGLNSLKGKIRDKVKLTDPRSPRLVGLAAGPAPKTTALAGDRATVLLGFNRRDSIRFRLRAAAPAAAGEVEVELLLDGASIARGRVGPAGGEVAGSAVPPRGVVELEVRAPPGTVLHGLDLEATRDPRGD